AFDDSPPVAPPDAGLPLFAMARIALFLRQVCRDAAPAVLRAEHFVGDKDPYVPLESARQFPCPLTVITGAGHDLNRSPKAIAAVLRHIAESDCGRTHLDPVARHAFGGDPWAPPAPVLALEETAPRPDRLDLEITTRCQFQCPFCARTHRPSARGNQDMEASLLPRLLDEMETVRELIFVGLGEPLLHPQIDRFVGAAAKRGVSTKLVTNGLLADPVRLGQLRDAGLDEVTFSIDTLDPKLFQEIRGGASLAPVLEHFRDAPSGLRKSIFVTLSARNIQELPGLIDLAVSGGLAALAVSDLNFEEVQSLSLNRTGCADVLAHALRYAREKNILLLGPHFHEVRDIRLRYPFCLAREPGDLTSRSDKHQFCLAPWRIAVAGADGALTPCNCAPEMKMGRLDQASFASIWNGPLMQTWRRRMKDGGNSSCLVCPRY
ncbi:MAG: radical SAM protein, partial [Lentisphaerota bacterium]